MPSIDEVVRQAILSIGSKPSDTADRSDKKHFSEMLSKALAEAFAGELRARGLDTTRPAPPGELDRTGAERRMSGGIGAKKVDVSCATEESGLLLAISIKTINFQDQRSRNFQKNLVNRRGDMLFEAVTLHRRFPYAVLAGFLVLDEGAARDDTERRDSTFANAHERLRLFSGREDPAGRDEQYERLFIVLLDSSAFQPQFKVYAVGNPGNPRSLASVFDELIDVVAQRDPDFYQSENGKLKRVR